MIASFSEERFPLRVSLGTSGGPERQTDVVRLSTGYESRNQRHRHSVRRYDAGSGIRSVEDLTAVLGFFEARRGKLVAFRFRDPLDWRTASSGQGISALDEGVATGDGMTRSFSLSRRYGDGADAYHRPISKPVAGSVRLAVAGVELGEGAGFTLDATTGTVTLATAPPAGAVVTAGYEFDVPVRFDIDHLSISLAGFRAGEIPSIPLVEVRP